jgi:glycine oxidase
MNNDVIIVGGGVIGCSIALKLAEAGLKVTLLERGRIGCEASRAAAGMLAAQSETSAPGPFFDLCLRSRSMYRDFADHLMEASGVDIEYKDEGMLFVALDAEESKEATRWISWQTEAGLTLERLSASEVRDWEPAVTQSAAGAVFIPGDHQVENRRLMDALEVAIRRAGVQVIEDTEVSALQTAGSGVTGVVVKGQRLDAGIVVVAAGTWSTSLLDPLGLNVKVVPARGQMIALQGRGHTIKCVLHSNKVYVVPRLDGRILIGATVDYAGFDKSVTAGGVAYLLSAAMELAPSLGECEIVDTWSGLRPDTFDHLPVIGPAGFDGLVLAMGHFRNGILLAPITAELIAESILTGRPSSDLKPFASDRFEARGPTLSHNALLAN